MKTSFFFVVVSAIFLIFYAATGNSRVIKPGFTGRYCAHGQYDINSGQLHNYDGDHWCGLHEIDFRACVSISYPDNTTQMGCDNDGGIFPTCNHDSDYCYQQGIAYICCCNSDHCNDCSNHPLACVDPLSIITTTTRAPPTTPSPSACPSGSISWQTSCLFFQSNPSAFLVAEKTCNDLGGHLSSIHDEFTNNLIAQYASIYFTIAKDFWIGGSDLMSPKIWNWTDGTPFTFNVWKNTPDWSSGDCSAESLFDGTWSVEDCFQHKPFVCTVSK